MYLFRGVKACHILVSGEGQIKLAGNRNMVSMNNKQHQTGSVHDFPKHDTHLLPWLSPEILQQVVWGLATFILSYKFYKLGFHLNCNFKICFWCFSLVLWSCVNVLHPVWCKLLGMASFPEQIEQAKGSFFYHPKMIQKSWASILSQISNWTNHSLGCLICGALWFARRCYSHYLGKK